MLGGAQDPDASAAVLDHREDERPRENKNKLVNSAQPSHACAVGSLWCSLPPPGHDVPPRSHARLSVSSGRHVQIPHVPLS